MYTTKFGCNFFGLFTKDNHNNSELMCDSQGHNYFWVKECSVAEWSKLSVSRIPCRRCEEKEDPRGSANWTLQWSRGEARTLKPAGWWWLEHGFYDVPFSWEWNFIIPTDQPHEFSEGVEVETTNQPGSNEGASQPPLTCNPSPLKPSSCTLDDGMLPWGGEISRMAVSPSC